MTRLGCYNILPGVGEMMKKKILVVARWPLGGIRTYMRYMFTHFPKNYQLTLLAASTQEDAALKNDAEVYGARLLLVQAGGTRDFAHAIYKELCSKSYDLILSQGFKSAVAAYLANFMYRVPHILTIHGIVEPQYLDGRLGFLKRWFLGRVLSGITVLYGVSNDILNHLYHEYPKLKNNGPQSLVVPNGIETSELDLQPAQPFNLREQLDIEPSAFIFGFFGRFMPQKGFDLLIEAVDQIRANQPDRMIAVVAVGSGDYIGAYKVAIREKGIEPFFYFLPFQPLVHHLYPQVDAIVMPSRWEASALLAMEALCTGTPLIATDCIGLRETIAATPAIVFESENMEQLIEKMQDCLKDNNRVAFQNFIADARHRYDVNNSTKQLVAFLDQLLEKN